MAKHTRRAGTRGPRADAGRMPAVPEPQGPGGMSVVRSRPPHGGQIAQGDGVLFAPGQPLRGVPGLAGREGAPRQFAYRPGYNFTLRPRGTEPTTFEQLRSLAALYDGIQLCEHSLQRVTSDARASRRRSPASGGPASRGTWAGTRAAA